MKRKLQLAMFLVGSVLVLTGCVSQKKNSTKQNPSHKVTSTRIDRKSSTKENSNAEEVSSTKEADVLWNSNKDAQLQSFIKQWAPKMKQNYVKYDGQNSLNISVGIVYPDDLYRVNVNGTKSSIGWSKSGTGKYDYNVVAIYNYDGTVPPSPSHITYFFAFKDGQPVVLVDQSRDGTPNLLPTKNNDVKSAFDKIATGKDINKNKPSSEETVDPKLVGLMLDKMVFYKDEDFPEPANFVLDLDGKVYSIGFGTPISTILFSIDGQTINYWLLDTEHAESTATAKRIKYTISLKELEKEWYSTTDQKKDINRALKSVVVVNE